MRTFKSLMSVLVMLVLIAGALGCEREEERGHHRRYSHGDTRWIDQCGCYWFYDGYWEAWIPPEQWTYNQYGEAGYQGIEPPASAYDDYNAGSPAVENENTEIIFRNDTSHDWSVIVDGTSYTIPPGGNFHAPASAASSVQYTVNGFWTGPSGSSPPGSSYHLYVAGNGYEAVN